MELDAGRLRIAERTAQGDWVVNGWVRNAVVLAHCIGEPTLYRAGELTFLDVPLAYKFSEMTALQLKDARIKLMAPTVVRRGAYVGQNTILLACFIGCGAYIDDGALVDGFVNVGSGAQVGKNVHLSTGVCLGGVVEPLQARPVIVEDNCFIGSNATIVEGVFVGENSVLGMGVQLCAATKVFDRATGVVTYGHIPPGSVVIPGTMPSACGRYSTAAAIIIKQVDAAVRAKICVNELLRAST